jgi:hypothetical protein
MITKISELKEYPLRISSGDLERTLRKIHSNKEDFVDGDLLERIGDSEYILKNFPTSKLNTDVWDTSESLVRTYEKLYLESPDTLPPIVLNSNGSIIDGTHRAKALQNLGVPTIKAYVPIKSFLSSYNNLIKEKLEDFPILEDGPARDAAKPILREDEYAFGRPDKFKINSNLKLLNIK